MSRRPALTLAAVFTLLGFLLATGVQAARTGREQAEPRKAQLVKLIEHRRDQVADLDQAVRELRADLARSQRTVSARSQRDREEARRAQALAELAGTTGLKGRGLVVKLSDADTSGTESEHAEAYRIHDADIQLVVNALFAAGAEAVAVNDSRLVATTPIRSAGGTIVVNFRPVSPPYTVKAIGASRSQFETSEIARRFNRWERLFGLGFDIHEETVTLPSYTGRVAITTAKALGEGDG